MNISLILQMAADAEPGRTALVCGGRYWTYAALWRAAQGAATHITESGCKFVALLDESSEATPIAVFGAALAGVPYVPLNYRLADDDLAALLQRISPALAIGDVERIQRLDPDGNHTCLRRGDFVTISESAMNRKAMALLHRSLPVAPHQRPKQPC